MTSPFLPTSKKEVEALGWENFYWLCMSLGVPGMLLLLKIAPWRAAQPDQCAS